MSVKWVSLALAGVLLTACGADDAAVETLQESSFDCSAQQGKSTFEIVDGLTATVVNKGSGRAARPLDYADVHTTLWLYDADAEGGRGQEIWTSGGVQPFQFQLGVEQVISGWDLGVPCMLIGEERELKVAANLGYGEAGKPPVPPNATLLFNIELVKLKAPD